MALELILLLTKNELLWKILSMVGYKKDICNPHMHNGVQNYISSSIPYKSEMTIKSRNSSLFLARENSSIRLFLTLPKLPTSPNYPYLASKELVKDTQEIKKIKKYKKSMLTDLDLRFSLEYNWRNLHPPRPLLYPSDLKTVWSAVINQHSW